MKAGTLAVRAANEYRRRDVIGYVGLRYYLLASSAKGDRWSREVACELVRRRKELPYRACKAYKGVVARHDSEASEVIELRDLHYPAPNEMLCEAALIEACAEKGGMFERHAAVFSNTPCKGTSKDGMLEPYFRLWKLRQNEISKRCNQSNDEVVIYFDIKQFYPSIHFKDVKRAWGEACESAELDANWRLLGENIIEDYRSLSKRQTGLPMGPIFAHVLGNLVLKEFDRNMAEKYPRSYFRYVDDMALVVPRNGINQAKEEIRSLLPEGLQLNEPKQAEMPATDWRQYTSGFEATIPTKQWLRLVSALKAFMLTRSSEINALRSALIENGFRFPFRNYSSTIAERSYWQRFADRLNQKWFRKAIKAQDLSAIIQMTKETRDNFILRFNALSVEGLHVGPMGRKLYLQRIRYLSSRLLYMATFEQMSQIFAVIRDFKELSDLTAIYKSIITSDVSDLLPFSESVTRVAAQLFSSNNQLVLCKRHLSSPELVAAWSVFNLYGVEVRTDAPLTQPSALAAFSSSSFEVPTRDQLNPFEQELLSLRKGSGNTLPHELLETAIDQEEQPVLDATLLFQGSS